ncbi:hypothetical protein [Tardiphaga sp. 42S5]|uniref:hypothetical protein n=1 Tax=Tardiphaga sp. 42S5 TaxID=1404799 RepID=UPI002A59CDDF|nr:hypothetical protein [Tardiphaga sp. 42S5]WPO40613.1 hypothetical protein SFY93_24250 [Tardiphaga sp. 42S5]
MVDKKRDFDEFVRRQQEAAEAAKEEPPFDAARELKVWLDRLNSLYAELSGYLADYVKQGTVSHRLQDVKLEEDFSGPYLAKTMIVQIGLKQIRIVPIGTMLIGSRGRVDIIGEAGRARLVLINAKVTNPRQLVQVQVVDPSKPRQTNVARRDQIEWAWRIVGQPPSASFTELNKDTFFSALLDVSNV